MKTQLWKKSPLIKIINNSLIDLPTPSNISYWWNIGSLLGLRLIIQIITGIFLAIHYTANIALAFDRIIHIIRDVNYGWIIWSIHRAGASAFFATIYIHIGRGIYYKSFYYQETWLIGVIILFITIATAFLGYVLPWGQISFWGATVITNLISAIPYIGTNIVQWLWGGFAIDNATLTRFFTLHFLLPFIISALVLIHLLFLHQTGSNNPLGTNSNLDKIPFHPYFTWKDLIGVLIKLTIILIISFIFIEITKDPENFLPANPLVTPIHIQPEWYFLFAYAILRSIPNKLGGVIALVISILILIILPFIKKTIIQRTQFYPINKILFILFIVNLILLTWIGARPVEAPYILTGQILSITYFLYYPLNNIIINIWDKLLYT